VGAIGGCEWLAKVSVSVGLLQCRKGRLREWHQRVPWPRYSRRL